MESFLVNIEGRVREVEERGVKYLVAPATIMVGNTVMAGSKGPLYYPDAECKKNPGAWNHVPLVKNHPTDDNGRNVAAHNEDGTINQAIWEKYGLGETRNDHWDGKKRHVEAWFVANKTQQVDPYIYDCLVKHLPIELSTGLHTTDVPATNGATAPDGRVYTHIATNHRPDHLAILPTQTGACSLNDGCGVLANKKCETCGKSPTANSNPEGINQYTGVGGSASISQRVHKDAAGNVINPDNGLRPQEESDLKEMAKIQPGRKFKLQEERELEAVGKARLEHIDRVVDDPSVATGHAIPERNKHQNAHLTDEDIKGGEMVAITKMYAKRTGKKVVGNIVTDPSNIEATYNRDWPQSKRDETPSGDFAGPDQSFPIKTQADVNAASHLVGKATDPDAVKGKIKAIAERKGLSIPDAWKEPTGNEEKKSLLRKLGEMLGLVTENALGAGNYGLAKRSAHADTLTASANELSTAAQDNLTHTAAAQAHSEAAQAHRAAAIEAAHPSATGGSPDFVVSGMHANAAAAHEVKAADHLSQCTESTTTNTDTSTQGDEMPIDRKAAVQHLTTNCDCWKNKAAVLNAMDDETLALVKSQSDALTENSLVVNAIKKDFGLDPKIAINAMPPALKKAMDAKKKGKAADDEDDEEDSSIVENEDDMTGNNKPLAEILKNRPKDLAVWNTVVEAAEEHKTKLVDIVVTANASTPEAQKLIRPAFEKMTVKELKVIASGLPQRGRTNLTGNESADSTINDYLGAGAGGYRAPTVNYSDINPDEILDNAVMDWEPPKKETAAK